LTLVGEVTHTIAERELPDHNETQVNAKRSASFRCFLNGSLPGMSPADGGGFKGGRERRKHAQAPVLTRPGVFSGGKKEEK